MISTGLQEIPQESDLYMHVGVQCVQVIKEDTIPIRRVCCVAVVSFWHFATAIHQGRVTLLKGIGYLNECVCHVDIVTLKY